MNRTNPGSKPIISGIALTDTHTTKQLELGTIFEDREGNLYKYIKAGEALVRGDCLRPSAMAAWDSGIAIDGALVSGDQVMHIDTVTTEMAANAYAGYWVGQAPAAGKGMLHQIKSHPLIAVSGEGDLYLEDPIAEAFADDVALLIYHPDVLEQTDSATDIITAVAIVGIASGSFGFVQIAGFIPAVKIKGDTQALVVDEPIVPCTTVGAGIGRDGAVEADIVEIGLSPLIAVEASSAAGFAPALMGRKF